MRDGFLGLRHDAVVGRDDQYDDIGHLRAARPHCRESLVTGRVEERDHAPGCLHMIGPDVLGDAARLTRRDARAADRVEQRGLAVIDVAHDRHDRRPRQNLGCGHACRFGKQRVRIIQLCRRRLVSHLLRHDHRGLLIENLVDRHHLPQPHQRLDDFRRLDRHLVGEIRNGDGLRHGDIAYQRLGGHTLAPRRGIAVIVMLLLGSLAHAPRL